MEHHDYQHPEVHEVAPLVETKECCLSAGLRKLLLAFFVLEIPSQEAIDNHIREVAKDS